MRMLMDLDGIGIKSCEMLNRLDIYNDIDLITYYPKRYDILKRDDYRCQICGVTAKEGAKLHVDHIKPISKGGLTVPDNLQTLCDRCNLGKSDKYEE